MTLEDTIITLTASTPSGGNCRIGDASFRVQYGLDFWEWEYQGEIYFDAQDLAEAILRGRGTDPRKSIYLGGRVADWRKAIRL
jgi:hypothetical protein